MNGTSLGILLALLLTAGVAPAQKILIKDAKTGKVIGEAEMNGDPIEIDGKDILLQPKAPTETEKKAKLITIPMVSLSNATVEETIAYLRSRARELDTTTPNPKLKGINIVVKGRDALESRVPELQLRHITLHSALQHVAEATQLTVEYREDSVVLEKR